MKSITHIEKGQAGGLAKRTWTIDTTFVLFFLAVEFGQSAGIFALDTIFLAATLVALLVLPYFLFADEKPAFGNWLAGRGLIAGFAILIGLLFKQALGTVLPDSFRFLPLTLLLVGAMLCCYIQFYSFLRLRLAK